MSYYCLSTRNIKGSSLKTAEYGSEPGEPTYLVSSEGDGSFLPRHQLSGRADRRGQVWAQKILKDAKTGVQDDGGDIVFLVHGYNVDANKAFKAHDTVANGLKDAGMGRAVVVSYDWPAKGSFLNYLEDDSDARKTAIELVQSGLSLFGLLSDPECRVRVHVMAHSMGALVVREALRAAAGRPHTREAAWGITQLILYGADISSESLGNSDGAGLLQHSQRVTNYFNRHDKALATSNVKRFLSSPRAGRHGVPEEKLSKIVDVDVSNRWLEVAKTNADGPLADIPLSHTFYNGDGVWMQDVVHTLAGDLDRREVPTRRPHTREPMRLELNRD